MTTRTALYIAGLLLVASQARAAVTDLAAEGFEVQHTVHIAAPAAVVYAMVVHPDRWWSSAHTYSGSATNMSLDAKAGGCWCERLADGGMAQHMLVIMIAPGKTVVLHGGLGPLMDQAVDGAMRWSIKPAGMETDFTLTYRVGGYIKGGFGPMSSAVDGVLGEQVAGLKRAAEGGK